MNNHNKTPFRYSDYRIEAPTQALLEGYIQYRKKASEDSDGVVNETTINRTQGLLTHYNESEIKNRTVFFVTEKRGVVGELFLSNLTAGHFCRLDLLFILKRHRGIGLGEYLLDLIVSIAKKVGCSGVFYVTKKDEPELAEYIRKKGFKVFKNKDGNEVFIRSFTTSRIQPAWMDLR